MKQTNKMLIGHRGCGVTKYNYFNIMPVENTLDSIESAIHTFQLDGVEFDVQLTSDNVPVLWHDDVIHTDDIRAHISELTLEQLQRVSQIDTQYYRDNVAWYYGKIEIPLLEQVLSHIPHDKTVNIELKTFPYNTQEYKNSLVNAISSCVATGVSVVSVVISSFDIEICILCKSRNRTLTTFLLISEDNVENEILEKVQLATKHDLDGLVVHVSLVQKIHTLPLFMRPKRLWCYGGVSHTTEASITDVCVI